VQAQRVGRSPTRLGVQVPPAADHRRRRGGGRLAGGRRRGPRRGERGFEPHPPQWSDCVAAVGHRRRAAPQGACQSQHPHVVVARRGVVSRIDGRRHHRVLHAPGVGRFEVGGAREHLDFAGLAMLSPFADQAVRRGRHAPRPEDHPATEEALRGRPRAGVVQGDLEGEFVDRRIRATDDARVGNRTVLGPQTTPLRERRADRTHSQDPNDGGHRLRSVNTPECGTKTVHSSQLRVEYIVETRNPNDEGKPLERSAAAERGLSLTLSRRYATVCSPGGLPHQDVVPPTGAQQALGAQRPQRALRAASARRRSQRRRTWRRRTASPSWGRSTARFRSPRSPGSSNA
jgi:hypothetical protein